jgi:hypothetical protein
MGKWIVALLLLSSLLVATTAGFAQEKRPLRPGAEPYIPTRIDWLTTVLQASLRTERLQEDGYNLQITYLDSETVLIYVRYLPTVNREIMNNGIETAREVIQITAKGYGWDKWLKVREDIQMVKTEGGNIGFRHRQGK